MSNILSIIKTTDQLTRFRDDLAVLQDNIYKTDDSFEQYLNNQMEADIAQFIGKELASKEKRILLIDYEKQIEKVLLVRITVSQQLSSKFIDVMSSYVKSTIGEAAILDIIVNKRILAGAIAEYKGRVVDNSINTMFEIKRDKVEKIAKFYGS